MRATGYYLVAILAMLVSASSALSGEYADTYASKFIPKVDYEDILTIGASTESRIKEEMLNDPTIRKLIEEGRSPDDFIPPLAGVYKEYEAARPFLRALGSEARPPFEQYASEDVDSNPIAVLWSQIYLMYEGQETTLTLPDDFRALLFLGHIVTPEWPASLVATAATAGWRQYADRRMQRIVSKAFIETTKMLTDEHFRHEYYDARFGKESLNVYWNTICGYVVVLRREDEDYAKKYLDELFLLRMPISQALWDPDWIQELAGTHTQYAASEEPWMSLSLLAVDTFYRDEAFIEKVRHAIKSTYSVILDHVGHNAGNYRSGETIVADKLPGVLARLRGYKPCANLEDNDKAVPLMSEDDGYFSNSRSHSLGILVKRWNYYMTLLMTLTEYEEDLKSQALICWMYQLGTGDSGEWGSGALPVRRIAR